jgi:L-threonylcarbamoyladenylate synthase
MISMIWNNEKLVKVLKEGKVAVIPTDTIYGVVGRAEDQLVVERIYAIRKRNPEKPCIILISDTGELEKFSISLTLEQKEKLKEFWPGPVSIILDCLDEKFSYLHRGTNTLAFRVPASEELRNLLKQTGPLIAPSANPEGLSPAKTTQEARNYFGDTVDLYIDEGEVVGKASKVIKLHKDGGVSILRE